MFMENVLPLFTIGHSTRPIEDFLKILKHYNITEVIDIRTIPKSRYNPQFNGQALAHVLRNHHIGYRHQKNLGGLRYSHSDSLNTGWKNASFRGFADYMQTKEFKDGLDELINSAHEKIIVIMCAEAVPWRCHRSLIADALLAHGIKVDDIFSITSAKPHKLTRWAKVRDKTVTYSALEESNG